MYSYEISVRMKEYLNQDTKGQTLEWGLYECPVVSKPRRCKKNITLLLRTCESRVASIVALCRRIFSWSKTQMSREVASMAVYKLFSAYVGLIRLYLLWNLRPPRHKTRFSLYQGQLRVRTWAEYLEIQMRMYGCFDWRQSRSRPCSNGLAKNSDSLEITILDLFSIPEELHSVNLKTKCKFVHTLVTADTSSYIPPSTWGEYWGLFHIMSTHQ
jgi:hypothetical protein